MSALPGFVVLPLDQLGTWYAPPFEREVIPASAWDAAGKQANGIAFPPGRAGQLAQYIFGTAHRPVREVAIVAALGWLAGVCGKAFTTPSRSGLNLYMILVAKSAVGKEAMHSGLSLLTDALASAGCVTADQYITFDRFASGPALRKAVAQRRSFVQVNGEWGLTLKAMLSSSRQPDGPLQTLKAEMTNLYQKSGPESRAGSNRYSDEKQNVGRVGSVAFSMIGETTPGTFRAAQSSDMMEDGFASRFSVVEYAGDRPPENNDRVTTPPESLMRWCAALVLQVDALNARSGHQACQFSTAALEMRNTFNSECDRQINASTDEAVRQVWNRADLKVQKVACLLAVADNELEPMVAPEHLQWAIWLVRRDIALYQKQLASGDVGDDDAARDRKLITICREYIACRTPPKGSRAPDAMHAQGVISRRYLQQRTNTLPAFARHPLGGLRAFNAALRSLCDSGYLLEMDKLKVADEWGFQGQCFRVTDLLDGLLD